MSLTKQDITRLRDLTHQQCEGRLEADSVQELQTLLLADYEARWLYRRMIQIHDLLALNGRDDSECQAIEYLRRIHPEPSFWRQWNQARAEADMTETSASEDRKSPPVYRLYGWQAVLAVAAAVVIGVGLMVFFKPHTPTAEPKPVASKSQPIPFATLTRADAPVAGDSPIHSGDLLDAQTVRTGSGKSEFFLDSGATILVRGESQLTLHDAMYATLTYGSAQFNCPKSAVGYRVDLPNGFRVIDQGTQFNITTEMSGQSTVRVLEGEVQVMQLDASGSVISQILARAGTDVACIAGQSVKPTHAMLFDGFNTDTTSMYTMTQSYGHGGNFTIDNGALVLKPGGANTVTVIRSDAPVLSVGARMSIQVSEHRPSDIHTFVCVSTAPQQPDLKTDHNGFRIRHDDSGLRVQSFPHATERESASVDKTDGPLTLIVERLSPTRFRCLWRPDGENPAREPTLISDFEIAELADSPSLFVGVEAYGVRRNQKVIFDNLRIEQINP